MSYLLYTIIFDFQFYAILTRALETIYTIKKHLVAILKRALCAYTLFRKKKKQETKQIILSIYNGVYMNE